MSGKVEERIAELARILGEPAEAIQPTNPRWLQLLQEGVVIHLTLRRWRARTTLDLEKDLGLPVRGEEAEELRELLDIGRKFLLPRRLVAALDSVDSAARQNLRRFGYDTFWGVFVPVTAYAAWKEADAKFQRRYYELRDEIAAFYDQVVGEHLAQFEEAARRAWRRFHELHGAPEGESDFALREEEFVSRYVGRLRALIPPAEEVHASFAYEVHLHYVPLPSILAEDVRAAAWIVASRKAQEMVERAKRDADTYWRSTEQAVDAWRKTQMEIVRQDVLAAAQAEKARLIDGFLADVARQLRGLVYDTVVSAYDTTVRNGRLHPRTVVQLRNLIAEVERLNFFGDQEVDRMIEKIRNLLGPAPDERSTAEVEDALRNVALVLKASLLALGDAQRGSRPDAGLPETVAAPELRRARRSLGLDVEIQPLPELRRARRSSE